MTGPTVQNYPNRSASGRDLEGLRVGIYTRASDDQRDTQTSITAQGNYGARWAIAQGCIIPEGGQYCDNDRSASWYATKERPEFERLLADIAHRRLDIIWFWQLSRSQRDLSVYVKLRNLCRANGTRLVIKNRVYDLNDPSDLRSLGTDAVNAEVQSVEISEFVRMGQELAASLGKPHAHTPYGYVRHYDERRRFVEQVPREPEAAIVREIITRAADGIPLSRIARELRERGIPTAKPSAKGWVPQMLLRIARNPAYIGRRVYQGQVVDHAEPCWTPIVSEDIWYAAQRILGDPVRRTSRPGRAIHLLSGPARCDVCGAPVRVHYAQKRAGDIRRYQCSEGRCASIPADVLDDFVRKVVDGYLARADVREFLAEAGANDAEAVSARGEAGRLRQELEEWKRLAEAGEIKPLDYIRFEKGIGSRIADAESRAEELATPSFLRSGSVDWADVPVARKVVVYMADVRIKPVGRGRGSVPVVERVSWRWLIGPDAT